MRRLLCFGTALSVFLLTAMVLGTLVPIRFVGWIGLLPAAFAYKRVAKITGERREREVP